MWSSDAHCSKSFAGRETVIMPHWHCAFPLQRSEPSIGSSACKRRLVALGLRNEWQKCTWVYSLAHRHILTTISPCSGFTHARAHTISSAQNAHTHLFPEKNKSSCYSSALWQHNCSAAQPDLGQVLDGGRMAAKLSCGFLTDWICPLICSWTGTYCASQNAVSMQIEQSEAWEERKEMELNFAFQGRFGALPSRQRLWMSEVDSGVF